MARLGQLGRFFKASGGTKADTSDDGVRCVRYGELYSTYGSHIRDVVSKVAEGAVDKYTKLEQGDVLFAASGETLEEIGKSAALMTAEPVVGGGDLIVLRPNGVADPEFLGYATNSAFANAQKYGLGRGVTVMHIYGSGLKTLVIPLPPQSDQRAISRFLDRETAKIDDLIGKKGRLLKLLDEHRTSLISEVVTKGLDPDVPMRDSGVEWIGRVPEHWNGRPKAAHLLRTGSGTTPASSDESLYGGTMPWVTTSELREQVTGGTAKQVSERALRSLSALHVYPANSVVIAMYGATIGRLGILGVPSTVNQACCVFYDPVGIDLKYWYYWLWAARAHLVSLAQGGGQGNLNQEILRNLRVPLPPIDEQVEIVSFLDSELAKTETLKQRTACAIDRLKELRTSLISEAVTGRAMVTSGAELRAPATATTI